MVIVYSVTLPVKKAEAVLPLAPLLIGAIEGVVIEKAVEYGIGFVDKQMAKSTANNIATKIYNKYSTQLSKVKPTKKGLGKLLMSTGGYILAEIIDELGDLKEDVSVNGSVHNYTVNADLWGNYNKDYLQLGTINFVLDRTQINSQVRYNVFKEVLKNLTITEGSSFAFNGCLEGFCHNSTMGYGDINTIYYKMVVSFPGSYIYIDFARFNKSTNNRIGGNELRLPFTPSLYGGDGGTSASGFINNGIIVHGDMINRYDTDGRTAEEMASIDWSKSLGSLPITIDTTPNQGLTDLVNALDDGIEIDLEDSTFDNLLSLLTTFLEGRQFDSNSTPIQTGIGLTDEIIDLIVIPDGTICTDENGQVISCEVVEKPDASLLVYIRNAYEYATNTLKVAVDGVKSLNEGSQGIIDIYKHYMGWLPAPVSTLLYSGLGIMIALRIFRK